MSPSELSQRRFNVQIVRRLAWKGNYIVLEQMILQFIRFDAKQAQINIYDVDHIPMRLHPNHQVFDTVGKDEDDEKRYSA